MTGAGPFCCRVSRHPPKGRWFTPACTEARTGSARLIVPRQACFMSLPVRRLPVFTPVCRITTQEFFSRPAVSVAYAALILGVQCVPWSYLRERRFGNFHCIPLPGRDC